MLTSQRKRLILDKLRAEGQVVAKSISHELDLSEDTIRRDLRELAQEGLLQRVHGGALPVSPAVADFCRPSAFWNRWKECDWPNCCPNDSIRPGCHPGWRYYGSSRSAPFVTRAPSHHCDPQPDNSGGACAPPQHRGNHSRRTII